MENLKNVLTAPYSLDNYNKFTIEFFNEYEKVPYELKQAPASFKDSIEFYAVHGTYKDANGEEIVILSVKVRDGSKAKQAQRNFVSYLLMNNYNDYNAALVAYYDDVRTNWKLSFVKVDYELSDKGIELKFKPAKRFSFLVGQDEPTKTYMQQLSSIYESSVKPTINDIESAFSVSRLSNDFYVEYKNKFFELVDYLEENENFKREAFLLGYEKVEKFSVSFCKKTLGQILFLHFVQKKGWLGVVNNWGDGDKNYLLNSTKTYSKGNYFNDILEPLFYRALNVKRENDLYLGKKIPFLNGGLFHPIENYNWEETNFDIPDSYWFNQEETGLLDILSQYNFTVDESDPSEQEVAIDPEMLGKIFESLLDTKDRSQLGAFYTPREIVHYMCEEALATRLSKCFGLDYESIANYIRYGDALKETDFIKEFATDIDNYVSRITIVDPAVGSGAFLVGMLNQIVLLRTNLMKYTNKKIDTYQMKLEAIQNSLYGVDLEFDAVEIAKLRLWLSLIVDQDANEECPKPLPNLNFRLRVGNSLVDTFDGIKLWNSRCSGTKQKEKKEQQDTIWNFNIKNRLKTAKDEYFGTSEEKRKQELYKVIEQEQIELIRTELVANGKYDLYNRIEDMIKKKTKPFFIWELEFENVFENGGFDIVIANPPYVQLQKDGGKLADELKDQGYETFVRMGDIYCIFYEKGIRILKDNGVLVFITSNKWMRAGYGEKLRGFLAFNTNPLRLIDFGGTKVFESATVDVNILIASKGKNEENTMTCLIQDDCSKNLSDYINQYGTIIKYLSKDNWTITNAIETRIKEKIEKPASNWQIGICQ